MENKKWTYIYHIALVVIFITLLSFIIHPNTELNEDLGRHLKLGQIISESGDIPDTNLFTYTNSNFPFLNHHWLSEVVYFNVFSLFGYSGIEILTFLILSLSFFLIILFTLKKTSPLTLLPIFLLFLPLIGDRMKVRPESFGYIIFAILLILFFLKETKYTRWIAPVLIVLWTNFHISFAFAAPLLIAYTCKEYVLYRKDKKNNLKNSLWCVGLSTLAIFINPSGWKGVLAPLSIFTNYGYRVVENQNIFFLIPRVFQWMYIYHIIAVAIIFGFFIWWIIFHKKQKNININILFLGIITLIFGIGGMVMVKNIPFFILSGIPTLALMLHGVSFPQKIKLFFNENLKTTIILLFIFGMLFIPIFFLKNNRIQMRTIESGRNAVNFFLAHNIPGNIFNNFDIGGYLDYRLYPKYKTFVDNRPEAFPKEFFDEYIAIQEQKNIREKAFIKYDIQSIIFSHRDLTPWAQEFLKQMISDKNWKAVYFDDYAVIFVKKEFPLQEIPLQSTPL